MADYRNLVEKCVVKPSGNLMDQAYQDYVDHSEKPTAQSIKEASSPCKDPSVKNQCAARMSVALARCGFDLNGFPNQRRVHRNRHICRLSIPHVVGAKELADFLTTALAPPLKFFGKTLSSAAESIKDQWGIIYFNNCFHRDTDKEGVSTGDHIDFWDGEKYYNQYIHVSAGGTASASSPLFKKADQVWFFPLL
jgi:hypothetical protein